MIQRGRWHPHSRRPIPALASLLALALLLGSCSTSRKAILLTDSPEILLAVELFNSTHDSFLIEASYAENIANSLARAEGGKDGLPSIVIGRGLNGAALSDRFISLDHLLGGLGTDRTAFYPALLAAGRRGPDQILLPVSFNALLVLASRGGERDREAFLPPGPIASISDLKSASLRFSSLPENSSARGFSPRWPDRDMLFQWSRLSGVAFREGQERKVLAWNADALEGFISSLKELVSSVSGSIDAEDAFAFKYLRAPGYKNVESGRILFAAMASGDYFLLPPLERARFAFRYFGGEGKIPILETALFAGIPRGSRGRAAAEKFLRWFFNPETHEALLRRSRDVRAFESSFGIAGGFSSLVEVTESIMPKYYSDLSGMLPPKESLVPAEALPPSWKRIKEELVLPWLSDPKGGAKEFGEALGAYLDKNPEVRK
ncbi:MAG TPA: hypothetical protein VIO60_05075 [Rectinemataceae bacterium]